MPRGPALSRASIPAEPADAVEQAECAGEPDPQKRVTLPGRYPGLALELALRRAKEAAAARRGALAGPTDEAASTPDGPRVARVTEPMAAGVVPPENVLPFVPAPGPPKRGVGHTERMAASPEPAAAVAVPPSIAAMLDGASAPAAGSGELCSFEDEEPEGSARATLVPGLELSLDASAFAITEPAVATSTSPLTPLSTMTMEASISPTLTVPLPPPAVPAPRRRAYMRAVFVGLLAAMSVTGALVAGRHAAAVVGALMRSSTAEPVLRAIPVASAVTPAPMSSVATVPSGAAPPGSAVPASSGAKSPPAPATAPAASATAQRPARRSTPAARPAAPAPAATGPAPPFEVPDPNAPPRRRHLDFEDDSPQPASPTGRIR